MNPVIADFHIHSCYSDSCSNPDQILRQSKRVGLTCIAITDHNTIKGGVETKKLSDKYGIQVIIGSEVSTECGDITGLNLNEEIKSHKWEEVIDEIKSQGGLVVFPHPYRYHTNIKEIAQRVDFIEVWNAYCDIGDNVRALMLHGEFKKEPIFGSDAHCARHVGAVRVQVDPDTFQMVGVAEDSHVESISHLNIYSCVVPNLIRKGEYRDILHLTNIRLRELLGYSTQHLL
jgi:predicted metal-dependent phosphoesterase TrpH